MNFLLVILVLLQTGIQPVYVDHYATEQECLADKAEQVKVIPRDAGVLYVASCLPVRNGTAADV